MTDLSRLLKAYDEQLRTDAETPSAVSVTLLGPLRLVTFLGGRGFVTYRDLGGADEAGVRELVDGVTLRRVTEEPDVRAMCAMQDEVFGSPVSDRTANAILRRQAIDPSMELWVAEADGQIVTAGRLEPVPGTDFAGIWGGSTRTEWGGRGIYRALTAARARSALAQGKSLINSDSTEYSRPILERYGFARVSTTTPYVWER